MTVYIGRIGNQRNIPKWLPFENYKSESLAYVRDMCTYVYQI